MMRKARGGDPGRGAGIVWTGPVSVKEARIRPLLGRDRRSGPPDRGETVDDFLRDRLRSDALWALRVLDRPHAHFVPLDRELTLFEQLMSDAKAGATPFADVGLNYDPVREFRRHEELRIHIDDRDADDVVGLDQLGLGQAGGLEQVRSAGVEKSEIARKEHDACWIAVAPLDAHLAPIHEYICGWWFQGRRFAHDGTRSIECRELIRDELVRNN
jgi:hypothetical protein